MGFSENQTKNIEGGTKIPCNIKMLNTRSGIRTGEENVLFVFVVYG